MEEYDVLVVGAGPAGAAAAKVCAEAGLKVLDVEKRAEIGSPKRCGEGLSKTSAERMGIEGTDNSWKRAVITKVGVYSPNERSVDMKFDEDQGYIIDRKVFDKMLAEKAAEAGAKVVAKTDAIAFERTDGKVVTTLKSMGKEWKVCSKIVVAADGVETKTARALGLETLMKSIDICSGFQYEMVGIDIDSAKLYFYFHQDKYPGGYAWIFPKGEGKANVGIGIRPTWAKKTAKEYLDDFVESHDFLKKGSITEVNSGGVPVGGLMKDMVGDNLIVAGDAAHHVNPIHGGGIAEAYVGGRIAGEVAVEAVKANDFSKGFLSRYNDKWWEERGKRLNGIYKLRQVVESLSNDDLDWLVDELNGDDIISFTKGDALKKFGKILLKRPKLALLARKLL